jgi:hypothetical protein
MSKRRKSSIPDFSSKRTPVKGAGGTSAPAKGAVAAPTPAPRVKPQATSAKSGRRGG